MTFVWSLTTIFNYFTLKTVKIVDGKWITEIFIKMQKFQIRLANQSNRRDGVKCMLEREPNWQAVDISLICNNFFCVFRTL